MRQTSRTKGRDIAADRTPQLRRPQVDRYCRLYASSIISELHRSVAEHNEIVAAIRMGDIHDVRRALDQNWAGGFERIHGVIEIWRAWKLVGSRLLKRTPR